MKILIFEGIAASGKTSVIKEICELLTERGRDFILFPEEKTLLPILKNKDPQVAIDFMDNLLKETFLRPHDFIIFDRFYLTHIFRTGSQIADFKKIENALKRCDSWIVVLKIAESKIPQRLEQAMSGRDNQWREYVSEKGGKEQIFEYYRKQQGVIVKMSAASDLPVIIYDTTNSDFKGAANAIVQSCIGRKSESGI